MKAVGYRQSLPIDHPDALLNIELPEPSARRRRGSGRVHWVMHSDGAAQIPRLQRRRGNHSAENNRCVTALKCEAIADA